MKYKISDRSGICEDGIVTRVAKGKHSNGSDYHTLNFNEGIIVIEETNDCVYTLKFAGRTIKKVQLYQLAELYELLTLMDMIESSESEVGFFNKTDYYKEIS
jgi:hypothetical protein